MKRNDILIKTYSIFMFKFNFCYRLKPSLYLRILIFVSLAILFHI